MADLKEYKKKRDFKKTEEPEGKVKKEKDKEPAYVIQCHDASRLHYDFRLEHNGTLLSWAVPKGPSYDTKDKRLAVMVEDHPFEYRNFEGTIPQGEYGGGVVMVWDKGTWEPLGDVDEMLKKGDLKFNVHGERLEGRWVLVRMKSKDGEEDKNWLLIKEKDGLETSRWKIEEFDTSVVSGKTFSEIGEDFYKENKRSPRLKSSNNSQDTKTKSKNTKSESKNTKSESKNTKSESKNTKSESKNTKSDSEDTKTKSKKEIENDLKDSTNIEEKDDGEGKSKKIEEKSLPFKSVPVMLAKLTKDIPEGKEWVYELKYDGYRILAYKDKEGVRLVTRNGQDYTNKFKNLTKDLNEWKEDGFVLDGEVVVFDGEKTDFQKLQNILRDKKGNVTYMAFDILSHDYKDVREKNLLERKEILQKLLDNGPKSVKYSSHTKDGKVAFETVCEKSMEGIVAKKSSTSYIEGRHGEWLKIKCGNRQEFIVVGFTRSEKRKTGVSSLLLGVMKDKKIVYSGRAGTGFTEKTSKDVEKLLTPLIRKTSPMENTPSKRKDEEIFFVTPTYLAEISFAELTDEGLIRQGSFKGIREDKDPEEVVLEKANNNSKEKEDGKEEKVTEEEVTENKTKESTKDKTKNKSEETLSDREIRAHNKSARMDEELYLTSGDKKMYGEYTKEDIDEYYKKVSKLFMEFGSERLLSLVRCPQGEKSDCFYQKHLNENMPGMITMDVEGSDDENNEYFYLNDEKGLRSAVQYGTIEFHGWGSKVTNLEKPDTMVFDLDPDEGLDLEVLKDAVLKLKSVLDDLDLKSFLKTSGGKGYHIVVPLVPEGDFEVIKEFSKNVANLLQKKWTDIFTSNMSKDKRKGKIYVDWVRNNRSSTSVLPFSLRARKGLPVSCPITWGELKTVNPQDINIGNIDERLRKKPWKDFLKINQSLK